MGMDDLDHSVIIAEKDWDAFFEESEECSLVQAGLAHLDDSGLSDSDDDKSSPQEPVLPLQTQPSKADEEHGVYVQGQSKAEDTEDNKCFNSKSGPGNPAEQTSICFSNNPAKCATVISDGNIIANNHDSNDQKQTASDTQNLRNNDEIHYEDKSDLPPDKSIKSMPGMEIAGRADSPGTVRDIMGGSANPKREKERWFVTVNDSPVQLRVKGGTPGTKKRRKKKTSRKLGQPRGIMKQKGPLLKNKDKADAKKMEEENEFEQAFICSDHLQFSAFPTNVQEGEILTSPNLQKVQLSSIKESGEKRECSALRVENCDSAGVPADNTENNPSPSLASQSRLFPIQSPHFQTDTQPQLVKDQSISIISITTNEPACSLPIISQHHPSHVHDNKRENNSEIFMKPSPTTIPSDKINEEQHYSMQSPREEKDSSLQEIHNKETCELTVEAPVSATHSIYVLSSFWDEMEKLTINDILHLRDANSRTPLGCVGPVHFQHNDLAHFKDSSLQDSGCLEDTTDSDYFTHSDDLKQDRSSCEFSTFSDFDEDFLQIVNTSANPSPEPPNVKEQTQNSTYIQEFLPEQQLELATINNESEFEDITMICPQDGMPLYLCPAAEASDEALFEMEHYKKTPSPLYSIADIHNNQYLLNFTELSLNDTDEEGLQTRTPYRCISTASFAYLSVPETYDDFFSDFEVGNLFFPSVQDKTVPIYTSSRSVVRDLVFPEVEDIVESDCEDDTSPIQVITRFNCQTQTSSSSSGTPNIYFFTNKIRKWGSLFSLRRITFVGKGSVWCQKVCSWFFPKEAGQSATAEYVLGAKSIPCLVHTGINKTSHLQHTVSIKRDDFPLSLKQADMCLFCIAFASWVLKSSNSQSTDMWKTALLANVSAISAIQYLRQYMRKKGTEDNV